MTALNHSFGLLAPENLLPILRQGLDEAGYPPSFSFDPSSDKGQSLPAARLILVILSEEVEKSLGRFEDRLYAEGQETLFDEAEERTGWDATRWANHLGPKLAPLLSFAPSPPQNLDDDFSDSIINPPFTQELDGLDFELEEGLHQETETPSIPNISLDCAEDFSAVEGSPLFQGEGEDKGLETDDGPPIKPSSLQKPSAPPAGWTLSEPGSPESGPLDLASATIASPASISFDTSGIGFLDEDAGKQKEEEEPSSYVQAEHERSLLDEPTAPFPFIPGREGVDDTTPNPGFALILGGTGGPAPIKEILGHLDERLPVPVIIRQHLPQGRYDALATNLGKQAAIPVRSAKEGATLTPGCAWVLEDDLIPELSQAGEWMAVAGDIALAISRVGDTAGALLAVSGTGEEAVFPAMEAVAAGALLIGQDPGQAYESNAIDTLVDLGMVVGTPEELGAHLMEHWGLFS